ncbi:MAG: carboxypeptidase-like regulatory domain-containing protein [Gemmataceae bacterium]
MRRLIGLGLLASAPLGLLVCSDAVPVLRGRVIGDAGPLANARVRWQGTTLTTRSDATGLFTLPWLSRPGRVTASAHGHVIAGHPAGPGWLTLHLRPLPQEDHPDYAWVDPTPLPGEESRCGNCHQAMYREWSAGGHARALSNPHFRNLYDGTDHQGRPGAGWNLLDEHPNGAGVCASCHAPALADADPARFDIRQVRGVATHGVHCDYCHKVAGPGDGEIGLTHGRFLHRLLRPAEGQLFFGPLDDVDRGEDVYSPYLRDSRFCAACHEGVLFGVRVYSTYSEWLTGPARRQGLHCQDCHMKPTGRMTNVAPGRGGLPRAPSTLANHHFWDGSQLAMLQRCLQLQVTMVGSQATVTLHTSGVGHAVPTGFIDRQLILACEAHDPQGNLIPLRTGPTLPPSSGPQWAHTPGRLFARITRDEFGTTPVPFWRALPEPVDQRLHPDQPVTLHFAFEHAFAHLRVRLLHRRFWAEEAQRKGWTDNDLMVLDRSYPAKSN